MPAWRQAPVLTEKAERESSNLSLLWPSRQAPSPRLASTICRLPLRHCYRCLPPPWLLQRVQVPTVQGALPITLPVHSGLAISSIIYAEDLSGKQSKAWMGFSVILFLISILASPRSLIWKNTRGKRRPHCHACLALSGAMHTSYAVDLS